ncbi:MAG: HD domain-containing protein [Bacteroidetes bacterium]|nr:HD domain-containing protein [Bacteroidota bacterium]
MAFKFFEHTPYLHLFERIGAIADQEQVAVYLVGGYVRDVLLQRPSKDIDFVVVGNGVEFAKAVSNQMSGSKLAYFKNFGTAQITFPDKEDLDFEFVGARKESYQRDSRKPIVEDGTLDDDLSRRDFTINALAVSLNKESFGEIVDQFGGLKHLDEGVLKTPLEPARTYSDDPLRMMRAIRFATQLGFEIHPESLDAIKQEASRIEIISQERITDELNKIILTKKPSVGFELLYNTGLLQIIFHELVALQGVETKNGIAHKDNFYHTLKVLDNLCETTDDLWLRWAAIMHDIGKPASKRFSDEHGWTFHGHEVIGERMTKGIFRRMKLPMNEHMKYVQKLVALHLRPIALMNEVTDSAIRRLIVDAGEDLDDLFKLCKADITSKNERKVQRIIRGFENVQQKVKDVEERDQLRNWNPPVTGEDVMTCFDLKPSRAVGDIKNAVREAILNGDIPNNRELAIDYMVKIGMELGLEVKNKLT